MNENDKYIEEISRKIVKMLKTLRENNQEEYTISAGELCERIVEIVHPDHVYFAVHEARGRGEPVIQNGAGYFYALYPSEVEPALSSLKARVQKIHESISFLQSIQKRLEEQRQQQPTLFGEQSK
jgi:prefoldin subunit 5